MVRLVFCLHKPKYNERFPRQYPWGPPPEFPLALPFSGIVHHLSGPNTCAQITVGCRCTYPSIHFHSACKFGNRKLAHMLDSVVRVPRRIERDIVVRNERQVSNNRNELSLQELGVRTHSICKSPDAGTHTESDCKKSLIHN